MGSRSIYIATSSPSELNLEKFRGTTRAIEFIPVLIYQFKGCNRRLYEFGSFESYISKPGCTS